MTVTQDVLDTVPALPVESPPRRTISVRSFVRPSYVIALIMVAFAIVVPIISSSDALKVNPGRRFASPSHGAILGTDHLGRDLGDIVAVGLRTSLLIAVTVVIGSGIIGWLIGAISGYVGGLVDNVLGRIMDVFNAFPGLILAIALVTALGPSLRALIIVLILCTWVNYARVVRARVMALKTQEYVAASRMYGSGALRILLKHIWPNTADLALSISLVQIPNVILAESTISFLGFGLQPPNESIGLVISDEKDFLQVAPYPLLFAGGMLVVTCSSIAMVALDLRRKLR